jgi:hypothetical protein
MPPPAAWSSSCKLALDRLVTDNGIGKQNETKKGRLAPPRLVVFPEKIRG